MTISIGFILALVTMMLFGLNNLVSGLLGKKFPGLQGLFLFQLLGIPLIIPFILMGYMKPIVLGDLYILILLGVFDTGVWFMCLRAFAQGKISIVSAILSTAMVVTVGISVLFFQAPLPMLKVVSLGVTLLGVILLTVNTRELKSLPSSFFAPGTKLALICMVGIGIYMASVGAISGKAGWVQTILFIRIAIAVTSGGILALTHTLPRLSSIPWKLVMAVATCDVAAFALFNITIQYVDVSTVVMITSCSTLVTALVMYVKYKERLHIHQTIGIGITTLALMLLSRL